MKVKLKPQGVEDAWKVDVSDLDELQVPEWVKVAKQNADIIMDGMGWVEVSLGDGDIADVPDGDYLIRNSLGELYTYSEEHFNDLYDIVSDTE